MPIVTNSPKSVVIRENANATYVIAGNSSVSNVALSGRVTGEEDIGGATISQVQWSTDGTITVSRGANVLFNLTGSGYWNLREAGMVNTEDQSATLVISTASANGTLMIEIVKQHANGYGSGYELTG